MKPLSDQDHFEFLEVSRDASGEEIERAYRMARATYADNSLAGYSVFGDGDAEVVLERIEAAYRVLSDEKSREAYAAWLAAGEPAPEASPLAKRDPAESISAAEDLADIDEESGEFDGARLRRSRLRRGIEIEEIAGITKISPNYLRCLEEERFSDLPAPVYVRGFIAAYATTVGLDPRRVTASYMKRLGTGGSTG